MNTNSPETQKAIEIEESEYQNQMSVTKVKDICGLCDVTAENSFVTHRNEL